MADLKEIRNQRGKAIADARAILDKADSEKRAMSEDETKQYDSLIEESQRLKDADERESRQQELEREAAELALRNKDEKKEERKIEKSTSPIGSDEYRDAFLKFCVAGPASLSGDEVRALSAGKSTEGGYLLVPEQMVGDILKGIDDAVFVRQKATKFRVPAATSLGVPTMTADVADADWTVELATGSEDSTLAFGKRALYPQKPIASACRGSRLLSAVALSTSFPSPTRRRL